MDYAEKFYDNKILRFLFDIIFQIIYLKDHFSYKINKKPRKSVANPGKIESNAAKARAAPDTIS